MNNETDRAKQFLAFAALSGFERLLQEREAQQTRQEEKNSSDFPEIIQKNCDDSC